MQKKLRGRIRPSDWPVLVPVGVTDGNMKGDARKGSGVRRAPRLGQTKGLNIRRGTVVFPTLRALDVRRDRIVDDGYLGGAVPCFCQLKSRREVVASETIRGRAGNAVMIESD